jgi:hypothetical protein
LGKNRREEGLRKRKVLRISVKKNIVPKFLSGRWRIFVFFLFNGRASGYWPKASYQNSVLNKI